METKKAALGTESGSSALSAKTEIGSESNTSGVTWSAVLAGAAASASLGLILLALGTGLGLSSVSVWSTVGASASAISKAAVLWLIVMQITSSSMGGYIAGRLRTKWTSIHGDEVYFRDTAHGFLAWSVSLVVAAAFLAAAAATLSGSPDSRNVSEGKGQVQDSSNYFVDELFRAAAPKQDAISSTNAEAGTIFVHALRIGELATADQQYLSQLVVGRTGLSQAEADARVREVFSQAKQSAEIARKATAHSLLWLFVALLIGAFCASFTATIGGKQRDNVVLV
jgi:hypothetical protein